MGTSNNSHEDDATNTSCANDEHELPSQAATPMMASRSSALLSRRKTEKTVLPVDYEPSKFCIIWGRGKGSYQSDGNINFRSLVKSNLERYKEAPGRLEKSFIVSEVLNMIRESCPVGAFVKYEKGRWYDLDDTVCREKVGSLFRDFLHTEYKSSSKAKHARKLAEKISSSTRPEKAGKEVLVSKESSDCDSGVPKKAASPQKKTDAPVSAALPGKKTQEEKSGNPDDPLAAAQAKFYDIDDLSLNKIG